MSLTGKNTLSLRKKDVLEQKQAGSAYKRLVFAHKATTAGQTGINITSLTQPSEMAALGFTNPSTAELQAGKMLFYKKNLTVVSSLRGLLIQDLSYTVPTNERIAFQDFTSEENEIFTCVLESSVKDGLQVVDAIAITSTGDLAIGATDYNVGTPFEVGKNITTQMGAVLVFRDGVIQSRNTSNGTSGGNYQEVDAGSGLGSIIRFNEAPVSEASSIIVVSNGMVAERPTGSVMAVVESLAGQVDLIIPTVADLAGVPETNFQGAPNNVDLKNFGDKVNALLTAEVPIVTDWIEGNPITIGAVTTPPTKGTTAYDRYRYRQVGGDWEVEYEFRNTGTGSAGSGHYLISLPPGVVIDTSKVLLNTGAADDDDLDLQQSTIGWGNIANATDRSYSHMVAYSSTQFRVLNEVAALSSNFFGSTGYALSSAQSFKFILKFPGDGLQATQTLKQQLGL
jgi:hypothetical protein